MARITLRNVRLAFPNLFEPKPFPNSPDPKPYFNCSGLMAADHPAKKLLDAAIEEAGIAKWADKWPVVKKAATQLGKICLRDGDLKADFDGYAGNWFISARSLQRPGVFLADGSAASMADGKPYAGCYVDLIVEIFPYQNAAKGIAAKLCGVKFRSDGDAFSAGGGAADADEFGDMGDTGGGAPDPLCG